MADDRPDPPPSGPDLYERDFYAWTQVQAQALRAVVGLSNEIDIEHIAEEIEDLGSEQKNAVATHLLQIIIHLHKLETSRALEPRNKWRREIRNHRAEIEQRLTRTIRRAVADELQAVHIRAARYAQASIDDYERGLTVDPNRRWTLAELLGEVDDPMESLR